MNEMQKEVPLTLPLTPSVRQRAELVSRQEGTSLVQFVQSAVEEKIQHMEHEAWMRRRKSITPALRDQALALLRKVSKGSPEPGDELPEDYIRASERKLP